MMEQHVAVAFAVLAAAVYLAFRVGAALRGTGRAGCSSGCATCPAHSSAQVSIVPATIVTVEQLIQSRRGAQAAPPSASHGNRDLRGRVPYQSHQP